jgi:hypothetical protein
MVCGMQSATTFFLPALPRVLISWPRLLLRGFPCISTTRVSSLLLLPLVLEPSCAAWAAVRGQLHILRLKQAFNINQRNRKTGG